MTLSDSAAQCVGAFVGCWSLVWSLVQLGLMGWQTKVVVERREELRDKRVPYFGYSIEQLKFPGDYGAFYEDGETSFYLGLLIVEILALVASAGLLLAALLWLCGLGRGRARGLLVALLVALPIASITVTAWAIAWFAHDTYGYMTTFTALQFVFAFPVNTPVFLVAVWYYRRASRPPLPSAKPRAAPVRPRRPQGTPQGTIVYLR